MAQVRVAPISWAVLMVQGREQQMHSYRQSKEIDKRAVLLKKRRKAVANPDSAEDPDDQAKEEVLGALPWEKPARKCLNPQAPNRDANRWVVVPTTKSLRKRRPKSHRGLAPVAADPAPVVDLSVVPVPKEASLLLLPKVVNPVAVVAPRPLLSTASALGTI